MGVPKKIKSSEELWSYFERYREQIKEKPIKVIDYVGKDAVKVYREKEKPLTFIGFQNWLDDNNIITDVTDYFENKDNRYSDFIRICSRIKRNIKEDQICGGMAGIYNPSITQRLNSLSDMGDIDKEEDKKQDDNVIKVEVVRRLVKDDEI